MNGDLKLTRNFDTDTPVDDNDITEKCQWDGYYQSDVVT